MYSVVGPDGALYGPADIPTLIQWRNEGRLTPETMLVDESGNRFPASNVPAIYPPQAPGMPGMAMEAPMQPNPYAAAPTNYPRDNSAFNEAEGKKLLNQAYIYGGLSLFCCPLVFGYLGWQAATKAEALGNANASTAKWVVVGLAVAGFAVGAVLRLASSR